MKIVIDCRGQAETIDLSSDVDWVDVKLGDRISIDSNLGMLVDVQAEDCTTQISVEDYEG